MQDGDYISVREAIERVGGQKYGKDWIGELTHRERWLVDKYRPMRSRLVHRPSMLPGHSGMRLEDLPGEDPPEPLKEEVARAWDRREWMTAQRHAVSKILIAANLLRKGRYEREPFEKFIRGRFGVPTAPPTGRLSKHEISSLIVEYMALQVTHSQDGFTTWVRFNKGRKGHREELRAAFNQQPGVVTRRGPKRRCRPNSPG
jgi:hypothetical protein